MVCIQIRHRTMSSPVSTTHTDIHSPADPLSNTASTHESHRFILIGLLRKAEETFDSTRWPQRNGGRVRSHTGLGVHSNGKLSKFILKASVLTCLSQHGLHSSPIPNYVRSWTHSQPQHPLSSSTYYTESGGFETLCRAPRHGMQTQEPC